MSVSYVLSTRLLLSDARQRGPGGPRSYGWKRQEWEQRRVMLTKARVSFSFMYMR